MCRLLHSWTVIKRCKKTLCVMKLYITEKGSCTISIKIDFFCCFYQCRQLRALSFVISWCNSIKIVFWGSTCATGSPILCRSRQVSWTVLHLTQVRRQLGQGKGVFISLSRGKPQAARDDWGLHPNAHMCKAQERNCKWTEGPENCELCKYLSWKKWSNGGLLMHQFAFRNMAR